MVTINDYMIEIELCLGGDEYLPLAVFRFLRLLYSVTCCFTFRPYQKGWGYMHAIFIFRMLSECYVILLDTPRYLSWEYGIPT